jgi:hypothetical protein
VKRTPYAIAKARLRGPVVLALIERFERRAYAREAVLTACKLPVR